MKFLVPASFKLYQSIYVPLQFTHGLFVFGLFRSWWLFYVNIFFYFFIYKSSLYVRIHLPCCHAQKHFYWWTSHCWCEDFIIIFSILLKVSPSASCLVLKGQLHPTALLPGHSSVTVLFWFFIRNSVSSSAVFLHFSDFVGILPIFPSGRL